MATKKENSPLRIEDIDQNLKTESALGLTDVLFHDVREAPFALYGFCQEKQDPRFHRLPAAVGEQTGAHIAELSYHTAGGRVRFSTDSPYIAIRCKLQRINRFPHITLCASSGFDLYETKLGRDRYIGSFLPPVSLPDGTYASYTITMDQGYSSVIHLNGEKQMRSFTVHFPLYNTVEVLEIGLQDGSALDTGVSYRNIPPIVYYGSSITQGGCASRPGNAYSNLLSAHLNIDHINLGFSGSALGEPVMADYIASLPMSLFVLDYDWNAPSPEYLKATHAPFFRTIREAQPELPILILSRPNNPDAEDTRMRKEILYATYKAARDAGDRNVYFLDGSSFFCGDFADACTVDGIHPNDAGFVCMARSIENQIKKIIG